MYYVDSVRKDRARLVVPEVLRNKLLEEVHTGGFSGHFAVKGLYGKLCRWYWWKGMYSDVRKFCKGCLTCGWKTKPPLKSIPVGGLFE